MPISIVKKLVDRLVTLPSANNEMFEKPEDERRAVRSELGRALERNCRSDEAAMAVVDSLMEGKFRPTPGDIRAESERLHGRKDSLPTGCANCLGTDFVIVERNGATGVKRCQCARGRQLAEKDKIRKQEEGATNGKP